VAEAARETSGDRAEVERANAAYYAAFEAGDLDAMRDLWLDDESTVCVHPGADPVRGTGPVGRSWALVMAHTPYIQFILTDVDVALRGDVASVTCTENVLTADDTTGRDAFGGARAVATNVFVRAADGWRLWIHHASPVLSPADDEPRDEFPDP
jgi:ketosteroid isomerase-like protein